MTLEEAKSMMTEEDLICLKNVVITRPEICLDNKVNCDIIIQALCNAHTEEILKPEAYDDRLVKLLNSATNTLSESKLNELLIHLRNFHPNMICRISITNNDFEPICSDWIFDGSGDITFNILFAYVIEHFKITPSTVRTKMNYLKATIVNNIAQLVSKYNNDKSMKDINVSITTITRLIQMEGYMIFAKLEEPEYYKKN